jgi:predicted O-linked N-acetylglucosamine transferase (SPINDLY family)
LPQSRLVLKYKGLSDPNVNRRFLDLFTARGVEPERLDLLPPTSFSEYLAGYGRIDIALDPFPFCGGTTTCEALWMGVPVISCPGETFASRHALSYLSNIGLTETIARGHKEYVDLAVSLAEDPPRLAAIRSQLRERMAASPLCDGRQFANDLMDRLRAVWRQWTANRPATN